MYLDGLILARKETLKVVGREDKSGNCRSCCRKRVVGGV